MVLMAATMVGCVSNPERHRASWEPVVAPPQPKKMATNGSIYQASREDSLFTNDQARRVGDVITVVLEESMSASKTASANATKDDNSALPGLASVTNSPILSALSADIATTKEFTGSGSAAQSNSLTGSITVTVVEVFPNGNLRVRGEKQVTINQGDELIRVSGVIRLSDITAENTVLSTQVADAQIVYVGNSGMIADSNTQGIFGRVLMSAFWPF